MVPFCWTISPSLIRGIFFSRFHLSCTWPCLFTKTVSCLLSLFLPKSMRWFAVEYFWLCTPYFWCWEILNTELGKNFSGSVWKTWPTNLSLKTKKYILCILLIFLILVWFGMEKMGVYPYAICLMPKISNKKFAKYFRLWHFCCW